jgi:hypothetical protein
MFWMRPSRSPALAMVLIAVLVAGCGDDATGPDSATRYDDAVVPDAGAITIHDYFNVRMYPGHLIIPEGQYGSTLIDHTGVFFVGRGGILPDCPYDDIYTLGQMFPTPEEHGEKFDRHFFQIAGAGASATFDLGCRDDFVIVALTQDHGPYPEEALEYRLAISDSPTGPFEVMTGERPIRVYRAGWSSAGEFSGDCDGNGFLNDDYVAEWDLPRKARYVQITPLEDEGEYNEPEIDAVMARQHLPERVSFDVMPGQCPNEMNVVKAPRLRVAIAGSPGLDVFQIDLSTVNIFGVRPLRTAFLDVAAPTVDGVDGDCTANGPDGTEDLVLEFLAMDVVNCSGQAHVEGEPMELIIRGNRTDRTFFYGTDRVAMHGVPECHLTPE